MQDTKSEPHGDTLARANLHTIGCFDGMGKTSAVLRIANPQGKDLDWLAKEVAGQPFEMQLSRILACLPLVLRIPALCRANGSIRSSRTAVAE